MPSRDLQAVMDAAVDAIILIDHRGAVTAFNRSAGRLFGYQPDEVIGRNVKMLMPEPYHSAHDDYLERYEASGIPHIIGVGREVDVRRKDGTTFPAFLSVGRVADTDPPRFVGFVRDVTTERQALATIQAERDRATARQSEEQEARRLHERLTHVARMATMGEMAGGIAHELNQPLSAIATYARACQRFLDAGMPEEPELRASLHEIGEEALRAGEIIRRLRQLVNTGNSERVDTDLNEIILDLAVLVQADARGHRTEVTLDLEPGLPRICVDSVQFQQMILSLVHNAIEATEANAPEPRRIAIQTRRLPSREIELSVSDNGPGLTAAMSERLFIPFATTKPAGTGLGLVISRTIVQAHGGSIGHRMATPHGACFYVRIPLAEEQA
ncbi:MAG: PAS domain S-box protein [Gammaproteobacteria bacterium]